MQVFKLSKLHKVNLALWTPTQCRMTFSLCFSYEKRSLADIRMTDLPLQEFQSSPPPGVKRPAECHSADPPGYAEKQSHSMTSPNLPEPPPPPKGQPPPVAAMNQVGILRSHGAAITPGTTKKRVQIQEISV